MLRALAPLFVCVSLIACSSSSGGGSGAGNGGESNSAGNGTGGGAAGTSSGGSAPGGGAGNTAGATGGAVRGGFSVNVQTAGGCALSSQYEDFPIVSNGHPVSATQKNASILDMEEASDGSLAAVHCYWFSDVSPYMIDAGIILGPDGNTREVSMNSRLVTGSSSIGGMSFVDRALSQTGSYTAACNFTVIHVDEASHSVWGSFDCSGLKDPSDAATGCTVGPSYFFFQNCTKP